MRIGNWCKKLSASLVAAGIFVPGAAYAVTVPIKFNDAGFEDFQVPAFPGGAGYAYSDTYRPTSAWVDDLDHNSGGYIEDDGASNWLYDAAYVELGGGSGNSKRPSPLGGNQAMHGFGYYSAQETSQVFEAGNTYTFTLWAQGDSDASNTSSRVWLYIFDGTVPFSEANSLTFARYAPDTGDFVNRDPTWTAEQSSANWTPITLSWTVQPGASEIGHPIGVGFWAAGDGAVDTPVPEPSTIVLVGIGGVALLALRRRL